MTLALGNWLVISWQASMPGSALEPDVHDHHVGLVRARLLDRVARRGGLGHDLEIRVLLQQGAQAQADDLVIIDEQNALTSHTVTSG